MPALPVAHDDTQPMPTTYRIAYAGRPISEEGGSRDTISINGCKGVGGKPPAGQHRLDKIFLNRAWMVGITACCFSEQIAVSVGPTVSPNSAGVPPPRARDQRRPMSAVPAMTLATHWPTYRRV